MSAHDSIAVMEEAIDHLMEATRLIDRLPDDDIDRQAAGAIAEAAASLRARVYAIRSTTEGERWPPAPEISG